jgi:hypothetical protein
LEVQNFAAAVGEPPDDDVEEGADARAEGDEEKGEDDEGGGGHGWRDYRQNWEKSENTGSETRRETIIVL